MLVLVHAIGGYYLFPILFKTVNNIPVLLLRIISSSAISFLVASVYMMKRFKVKPKLSFDKEVFMVAVGGIVISWILIFIKILFLEVQNPFIRAILQLKGEYLYVTLFLVAVWGPILEELFFRGMCYEILIKKYTKTLSLIIVSIIFVIFHILWKRELNICAELMLFFYSVIFTWGYIEGGLIASIIIHSFVNFYLIFLNS